MPRKGQRAAHTFDDDARGPRLQRVLADAGVGSRRRCEDLIASGVVRVNGVIIDVLPAWVDPARDRIEVEGRTIAQPERHIYVMLYKPKGTVSTNDDPEGRRRAIDLVKHPSGARLYPVGRLDIDSSGLLLLTNDGELANRLTHPRYEIHKVYEVTVAGAVPQADLTVLEQAIYLPSRGGRPGAGSERSSLQIEKRDRTRTQMLMQLGEGSNREIRRTLMRMGHPVKKLRRVQMGALRLKGLAIGEWRDLTAREVSELRADAFRTPAERLERAERRARTPRPTERTAGGRDRAAGGSERGGAGGAGRGPGRSPSRGPGRSPSRGPGSTGRAGRSGPYGPRGPETPGRAPGPFKRRGSRGPR